MKFGRILNDHIQPEYDMYYIQYNTLKKNIIIDEIIFINQLKIQIDIVDKFYNQNKNEKDLLNFSLLNLFAILKIVKKFNKKNEINTTKIIHHYYIKKTFYKDLFDSTIEHNQQNINDECIELLISDSDLNILLLVLLTSTYYRFLCHHPLITQLTLSYF